MVNENTSRKRTAEPEPPPRPKMVERSSIIKAQKRPEGTDLIHPLIGLRSTDPDKIDEAVKDRAERIAKIKSQGGGDYRVIQGKVHVPRPKEEFTNLDGSMKPNESPFRTALMGDILRLTPEDAFRLTEQDIVEELDAKPSRVGKVFAPPKVVRHFGGMPAPGERA